MFLAYDLTTNDLTNIEIVENDGKCLIRNIIKTYEYYGSFILDKNNRTKILCEIDFYRSSDTQKYLPRLTFRKVDSKNEQQTIKIDKDIIVSFKKGEHAQRFWKMISFLQKFKNLVDTDEFDDSFQIAKKEDTLTDEKVKEYLKNNPKLIQEVIENDIDEKDIVSIAYRKNELKQFKEMLNSDALLEYKKLIKKPNTKDETAWQHFFMQNQWIFGYGLDYRFQGVLQKEFHASDTTASGKDGVIADYLLGDKRFTTFVELKLPTTLLFGSSQNRAKSWKLSNELTDAYSQILEQKASSTIKIETTKDLYDDNNNKIVQHSYDSKTILIIGSWKEVEDSEDGERVKEIKRKTFELFRRDSRNVEIMTYDELYERASFIVREHTKAKGSIAST